MLTTEINKNLEAYILRHTDPEDEVLKELYRETYLKVLQPRMMSGHLQGKLLTMISKMLCPKAILEIGTFTGYSAICLARGLDPGGKLHTIERNDELIPLATKYFEKAGLSKQIIQYCGNACEVIDEIDAQLNLVFIDGDKSEYLTYYKKIFPKVKSGSFILADNVLWNGKVIADTNGNDRFTTGISEFNHFIMNDDRIEKILLPIRDGIMIIRKR